MNELSHILKKHCHNNYEQNHKTTVQQTKSRKKKERKKEKENYRSISLEYRCKKSITKQWQNRIQQYIERIKHHD